MIRPDERWWEFSARLSNDLFFLVCRSVVECYTFFFACRSVVECYTFFFGCRSVVECYTFFSLAARLSDIWFQRPAHKPHWGPRHVEKEKKYSRLEGSSRPGAPSRKKNAEQRVQQMKDQAINEIKNMSVKIAIESVENLLKNSIDKAKLDKIYLSSIEETKLTLKNKSS